VKRREFDSAAAAARALADEIAAALRSALALRGRASLLLPGGRTPVPLFHALRTQALPWERVRVSLTDERWVPESDPASNAALVRRELLTDRAAAAPFVPLYNDAPTAAQGASRSWRALAVLPQPFDVVVLGMGEDGHFASLFPQSPGLAAALDVNSVSACVAMRAPTAPIERISLNLAALAKSRAMFLFVAGATKRELLQRAAPGVGASELQWPVVALLALTAPPLEIYGAP
jgi:6-phosphogluconolactonase